MNLADVSRFFDRTRLVDASTQAFVGVGQMLAFDESRRDNATSYRRTLSTAPGVTLPNTIQALGQTWLVGTGQVDGWEQAHRVKTLLQRADGLVHILTPEKYLAGYLAPGVWAAVNWSADRKELSHSSDVLEEATLTMPLDTVVPLHAFILYEGSCYLVMRSFSSAAGFSDVRASRLSTPETAPVSVKSRQYSPATGTTSGTTSAVVSGKLMLWQDFFSYFGQGDERHQEGDSTLLVPATTAVTTASEITTLGRVYTVLAIAPVAGVLALHVRPRK